MKELADNFPGDKCYIFDRVDGCFCASYEPVRAPSADELRAIWKKPCGNR
ncbi:MAG: hypothetical protein WAX07_10235 [Candidatus Altiarchaeia archaeon]